MNAQRDRQAEVDELRLEVRELREALEAIRSGGVDALVIGEDGREQVYALASADRPYRVVVENMGEGAATLSSQGTVLFANRQLARLLGQEIDEVTGQDLAGFVEPAHRRHLAELLDTPVGETQRGELLLRGVAGASTVFLAVTGLDIDGVTVLCVVATDLTHQKRLEAQLAVEAAQAQSRAERLLVAREVNDTIVQGLVGAETALDLGEHELARRLVADTSRQARSWIGELLGGEVRAGAALRTRPARHSWSAW
jgi:PAS domain S-box-containing protein